jgi:hypothetical protein
MALVHRFQYFDVKTQSFQTSGDFATEVTIARMGWRAVPGTQVWIDDSKVGHTGIVLSDNLGPEKSGTLR